MSFGELVASLLGLGAVGAKSSIDLRRKDQSPEAQQGWAEYEYLYGKVPTRKGYNRVLEFDVIHAKIREILKEIGPERVDQYYRLIVSSKEYPLSLEYGKRIDEYFTTHAIRPYSGGPDWYKSFPDMKISEEIRWFEYLDEIKFDPSNVHMTKAEEAHKKAYASKSAQFDWYQQNCKTYVNAHYSYWQYLTELARKTAYDNGYLPTSQEAGRNRPVGYANIYDGRIYPTGISCISIDWAYGIPDQNERARAAEFDKTGEW